MNSEKYNPRDILKGYARNSVSGERALKDGRISVVPLKEHWEKSWRNGESAVFVFDESSTEEVNSRVIEKIRTMGEKYGIGFWLAGDTYKIHSTLVFAYTGDDTSDEERLKLYKKIETDPETQALLEKINIPIKLTYKYLLINGDNITLNADDIPELIISFRRSMIKIFERYNLPIIHKLENFLHITIARIKRLPTQDYEEKIEKFKKELRDLRHEISRNPIQLKTTEKIFLGTNPLEIP